MDSESNKPFPYLPSELVFRILDIAARESHSAAQSISLVSTWARKLVLLHLFDTVVYRSKPAYSSGMTSGAEKSLHARNVRSYTWGPLVRNLWMESTGLANVPNEGDVFRGCPNIENLALVSASLRTLASSIQSHNAASRNDRGSGLASPNQLYQTHLRSITLISHTFRYDWHFLSGLQLQDGSQLLQNITHLQILDMVVSAFSPHNLLPNLTHLALPYLDLGNDFKHETLRLPPGVLEHRALRMIVLTVAEEKWMRNSWYWTTPHPGKVPPSPTSAFREVVQWARSKDDRLHVIVSPGAGVESRKEWVEAVRGGPTLWEMAANARADDSHGANLPKAYPKGPSR